MTPVIDAAAAVGHSQLTSASQAQAPLETEMNPTLTHMVVKDRQREIAAEAARGRLVAEARREARKSSPSSGHGGATGRFRFALTALVATLWR